MKKTTAADLAKLAKSENQAKTTTSKDDKGKGQAGPAKQSRPKV